MEYTKYSKSRGGLPHLGCALPLARIRSLLLLEVPIGGAALHETAPRSAHRADDDFLVVGGGYEAKIRLFYKYSERKRLEVGRCGEGSLLCHDTRRCTNQAQKRRCERNF